MVLGATHGQQMGEGRRPQSASSQNPILGFPEMPPHYKVDNTSFKSGGLAGPPTCVHNKSILNKDAPVHHSQNMPFSNPHPLPAAAAVSTPSPQPFTAPWLTDVARMTPLSFPSTVNSSVAEYYHHYHNLPPRTHFYTTPFISPTSYIRDFPHPRHLSRNLTTVDSRSADGARCSTSVVHPSRPPLHLPLPPPPPPPPPLLHPLLPPPLPPPSTISTTSLDFREGYPLDLRDQRELALHRELPHSRTLELQVSSPVCTPLNLSPKEHYGDSSTKKRHSRMPLPSVQSSRPNEPPLTHVVSSSKSFNVISSLDSTAVDIKQHSSSRPSNSSFCTSLRKQSINAAFHSHFKRGSLVTVGQNVRRVEELQTSDFIEAANAAEDLELDPSTVGTISTNAEKHTSTITFYFPSRKKEIPVEASDDHPFFVFHKGWSSCDPHRTLLKYDLTVRQLMLNDVCVSLRKKSVPERSEQSFQTDMPPPKTPTKTSYSSSTNLTLSSVSSNHSPLSCTNTVTSSTVHTHSINTNWSRITASTEVSSALASSLKDEVLLSTENLHPPHGILNSQKSCPHPAREPPVSRKRRWSDPGR